MLEEIINSKSKTFMAFCFCFLAGVALISIIDKKIPFVWLYLLSFIILSFIIIFWSNTKFRFVLWCLSVLVLGVTRYQLAYPISQNNIANFTGRNLIITGYVAEEPDVRQDGVNYIINIEHRIWNREQLRGKIYFKYQLYPRYNYGDKLKINCELQAPEPFVDFRYDMYLANQGIFTICNNPTVEKIDEGGGNFLLRNILRFKNTVMQRTADLWQEPYASFMAGILYGYRGGLGELNNLFARTGITHIIAISGYNISIIASVLIILLMNLAVPRKKAFWIIAGGIILFTIFTGASASVVRASVMGILVLTAKQIGRLSRMANVLTFTAVVMVLLNPLVLIWDAGFQLSFISTLGLIYLSPLLVIPNHRRGEGSLFNALKSGNYKTIVRNIGKGLLFACGRLGMTETLSAILATLPLILFQFGRLSIVALPVNILILWTIPFLMLGGFLSLIISFIFFPLGQVIAWITWVGMAYVVGIVKFFGNLKFAAIDISIPWWLMILMYAGMIYVVWRKKLKF